MSDPLPPADTPTGPLPDAPTPSVSRTTDYTPPLAELADPDEAETVPGPPGYEILRTLGAGGMGVVYLARQTKLNRVVALKMVLGGPRAGRRDLIRFLAEAEAVAAVRHPNVVQVFQAGEADGRPFLAMEHLPGGSLADRIAAGGRPPFRPKGAADLVRKLALGLGAAHDLGIVHRDLKPGNVLFDEADEPKVTDFGLAKRGTGADLTATQAVMGTPAYMAPEQAKGETKFVNPAADVYALGVVLYECLTGTRPFAGPDPLALLRQVVDVEPDRPSKRAPGIPRDLELICLTCLAKDPGERYPTAGALAADLGRFGAGRPVSVRAAGPVERGAKWARRNPARAAAVGLTGGFVAAVSVAVVFWALSARAAQQRDIATEARNEAVSARATAEAARGQLAGEKAETEKALGRETAAKTEAEADRRRLDRVVKLTGINAAAQDLKAGQTYRAGSILAGIPAEVRGWEWGHLATELSPPVRETQGGMFSGAELAFPAPDGGTAVVIGRYPDAGVMVGRQDLFHMADVWDLRTWTARRFRPLADAGENLFAVHLSADGSKAAAVTGGVAAPAAPKGPPIMWAGAAVRPTAARLRDVATGKPLGPRIDLAGDFGPAGMSPDGARLLGSNMGGTLVVWDMATGERTELAGGPGRNIARVFAPTPDGLRVVGLGGDGAITVWNTADPAKPERAIGKHAGAVRLAAAPDGQWVASWGGDRTVLVWRVREPAPARLAPGLGVPGAIAFDHDGGRLAVAYPAENRIALYDLRSMTPLAGLTYAGMVVAMTFAKDGSGLLLQLAAGTALARWDLSGYPRKRGTGSRQLMLTNVRELAVRGDHAAGGGPDGVLRVVNGMTGEVGKEVRVAEVPKAVGFPGMGSFVPTPVGLFPKGDRAAVAAGREVSLVTFATGGKRPFVTAAGPVDALAVGPDARLLAVGDRDGRLTVYDLSSGKPTMTGRLWPAGAKAPPGPGGYPGGMMFPSGMVQEVGVTFSRDGRRVAAGSGPRQVVRVWEVASGKEVGHLEPDADARPGTLGTAMAPLRLTPESFHPDGRRLLVPWTDPVEGDPVGAPMIAVWAPDEDKVERKIASPGDPAFSAVFSPDGTRIATAGSAAVRVWDPETGQHLLELSAQHAMWIGFAADGRQLRAAGINGVFQTWDSDPTRDPAFWRAALMPNNFGPGGGPPTPAVQPPKR